MCIRDSFKIVRFLLELRQSRIGEIKRNTDDRLPRRTSPFVGEIARRAKLWQAFGGELAIELLDKALHRRPGQRKPQLANRPAQKFLVRGRFSFCDVDVMHNVIYDRSLTNSLQPRKHTRGETVSLRLTVTESTSI